MKTKIIMIFAAVLLATSCVLQIFPLSIASTANEYNDYSGESQMDKSQREAWTAYCKKENGKNREIINAVFMENRMYFTLYEETTLHNVTSALMCWNGENYETFTIEPNAYLVGAEGTRLIARYGISSPAFPENNSLRYIWQMGNETCNDAKECFLLVSYDTVTQMPTDIAEFSDVTLTENGVKLNNGEMLPWEQVFEHWR